MMEKFQIPRMGGDKKDEVTLPELDWEKQGGLVPAIVQDNVDGAVLMVGFMDKPALAKTLETGKVSFFSRTRGAPWTKGETSGNFLNLTDMAKDCEGGDTLSVLVDPIGPTCSEGNRTCFDGDEKQIVGDVRLARIRWALGGLIEQIDQTFEERQAQMPDESVKSYTLGLLRDPNKALKKFGEEGVEYIQAVIEQDVEKSEEELADLVFSALAFARSRDKKVSLANVMRILTDRNQAKKAGSDERFNLPEKGVEDGAVQ